MARSAANALPERPGTWTWPEERWRPIVEKIRAGRSLKPDAREPVRAVFVVGWIGT